jgi:hypothetical protein
LKIKDLHLCIKNSWCVEKHWDAIVEALVAAEALYFHQKVYIESSGSGDKVYERFRDAIKKLSDIE